MQGTCLGQNKGKIYFTPEERKERETPYKDRTGKEIKNRLGSR